MPTLTMLLDKNNPKWGPVLPWFRVAARLAPMLRLGINPGPSLITQSRVK